MIAKTAASAVFLSLAGVGLLSVSGCSNAHYRPCGHQDTRIDVSPDDATIVFNAAGEGGRDLYLLRLLDRSVVCVAETPQYEVDPSFSPDGREIVYAAGMAGDRADHLYLRRVSGGPPRQLTNTPFNDSRPRMSADGTEVTFIRDMTYRWGGLAANWSGEGAVCVVDREGRHERELAPEHTKAFDCEFSDDGQSILFSTVEGRFSVPRDGSARARRIDGYVGRDFARLHTGGKVALSQGEFAPDRELFVMESDGSGKLQLTRNRLCEWQPLFARKSPRVFFLRDDWSSGEPLSSLWWVKLDGQETEEIADSKLFSDPLNWRPSRASTITPPTP